MIPGVGLWIPFCTVAEFLIRCFSDPRQFRLWWINGEDIPPPLTPSWPPSIDSTHCVIRKQCYCDTTQQQYQLDLPALPISGLVFPISDLVTHKPYSHITFPTRYQLNSFTRYSNYLFPAFRYAVFNSIYKSSIFTNIHTFSSRKCCFLFEYVGVWIQICWDCKHWTLDLKLFGSCLITNLCLGFSLVAKISIAFASAFYLLAPS